MRLIQPLLILFLVIALAIYFAKLRSSIRNRVIVLTLFLLGTIFVSFPDTAQTLAEFLGVGRGADLLFYLSIFALSFLCLVLYSRTMTLDAQITELARRITIDEAVARSERKDQSTHSSS